jgi:K319L-like, PKD domain/Fibronectin type III domain
VAASNWKCTFRSAVGAALLLLGLAPSAHAASVVLSWSANSESDLGGYIAYWGGASRSYPNHSDVGTARSLTIPGLVEGNTYFFAVKAYDNTGNQSAYSAEVSLTIPTSGPSDTTAPSVTGVNTTSATTVVVTFSEAVDPTTAEDPGSYTIDGGAVAVLSAVLDTDGLTVRLTTAPHALDSFHTLLVSGVADRAVPPNLADDTVSYQAAFGLQVDVISPSSYGVADVMTGDPYYVDASFSVLSVPAEYRGATWILTANGDVNRTSTTRLRFTVDRDVVVFVGYDRNAASAPDWLTQGFVPTGEGPMTTDGASPFIMWARDFPAGEIDLGGNSAPGASGAGSNYIVLVQAMDTAVVAGDGDGDGMTDTWESAVGLNPSQFDAHDDPDGDGLTNLQEFWLGTDPLAAPAGGAGNTAPTVTLDGSVVGTAGQPVTLDASAADDADGDALNWQWHQTSGPGAVVITNADRAVATFTPTETGIYSFTVAVTDGRGGAAVATTDVEVYEDVLASTITALGANLVVSQGALTGAVLSIPLGAMDKTYQVAVGSTGLPKALPAGDTAVGQVVHFSPSDMPLSALATIRVPYTRNVAIGFDNLELLRYDPETDAWEAVAVGRDLGTSLEASVDLLGTFVVVQKAGGSGGGSAASGTTGGGCAAADGSGAGDLGLILLLAMALLRLIPRRRVDRA